MGKNLYLLLGFWFWVLLAAAVGFVFWMTVRMLLWRRAVRKAQSEDRQARLGPDGRPVPTSPGGLCDRCGNVFDKICHLPGGVRRCPACYKKDPG